MCKPLQTKNTKIFKKNKIVTHWVLAMEQVEELRRALPSILETLPDLKNAGTQHEGACPFCGGKDRLYVPHDGKERFACRQCESKGDRIDLHMKLKDCTNMKDLADIAGISSAGQGKRPKAPANDENLTDTYNYTDSDGAVLFSVGRYEAIGYEKTFRQWHVKDGKKVSNIRGVMRVPYNLEVLAKSNEIVIVEGEKDVNGLGTVGVPATCFVSSTWRDEYGHYFRDKVVTIIPDNDAAGKGLKDKIVKGLNSVAKRIKVLSLPGLKEKGDVSDWLVIADNSPELLGELIKNAPEAQGRSNSSINSILARYEVKKEYVDALGKEEFIFDNLIIRQHILIIIAESGGGKTTFIFFHVAAELAKNDLTVWYIDADSPASDHKKMKTFADDNDIKFIIPDVNQGTSVSSLVSDITALTESQEDLAGFVFFFDTLKKFIDLMSKKSAKDFFVLMRKLTKLGATVVLLGHANKHRDKDGHLIFEGVGDVKSDSDDLIFFEKVKKADGSIDVTTVVDIDKGAKVRGIFKPFSFHVSTGREVTFYDKVKDIVDLTNTGVPAATPEEIIDTAVAYLKSMAEPVAQNRLVEYTADKITGKAGKDKVRRSIVQRAVKKGEPEPFGTLFVYTVGERNSHFYELPGREDPLPLLWS